MKREIDTKKHADMMDVFCHWCRDHGLKITAKRLLIFEELMQSRDHPSPEMLFKRLQTKEPKISLDTVYRTLGTFCEGGLIDVVEGFALTKRFDPNQDDHHHVRCTQCQAIVDFENPKYDHLKVPASIQKSFNVKRMRVTIEGLCQKCQSASKKKE